MPADRFSLTVRVGSQIHFLSFLRKPLEFCQGIAFSSYSNILRLVIILDINAERTLREVSHMPFGSDYIITAPQVFLDRFYLSRRLHYY